MNEPTNIRESIRRRVAGSAGSAARASTSAMQEAPDLLWAGERVTELAGAAAEQIGYDLLSRSATTGGELARLARDLVHGALRGAREIGANELRVARQTARGLLRATYAAGANPVPVARGAVEGAIEAARAASFHVPDTASATASALVEVASEVSEVEVDRLARALSCVIDGVAIVPRGPGRRTPPKAARLEPPDH